MRWLVVRGGALGDFILTLPALEAVRAVADHLTLAASPRYAALRPDLSDAVVDLRGTGALWLFGAGRPPGPLPDAALVFTPEVAEVLAALGVPRIRVAAPRPPPGVHAAAHLHAPVADLAPLTPPRLEAGPAPDLPAPWPVVLAPGAASPDKVWPGFARLAALLAEAGVSHVWASGVDEAPPRLQGTVLAGLDLAGLRGLAGVARAWVGNDTGTTHLAAAVGAPTLALFGPTDPRCWAPPGARVLPFSASPEEVFTQLLCAAPSHRDNRLLTLRAATN